MKKFVFIFVLAIALASTSFASLVTDLGAKYIEQEMQDDIDAAYFAALYVAIPQLPGTALDIGGDYDTEKYQIADKYLTFHRVSNNPFSYLLYRDPPKEGFGPYLDRNNLARHIRIETLTEYIKKNCEERGITYIDWFDFIDLPKKYPDRKVREEIYDNILILPQLYLLQDKDYDFLENYNNDIIKLNFNNSIVLQPKTTFVVKKIDDEWKVTEVYYNQL